MKVLLLLLVLSLSHLGECRVASSEMEVATAIVTVEKRMPLHLGCLYRNLHNGDPYDSIVVKWHNQLQRFTWDSQGGTVFQKNYKHEVASHSYPPTSGLSGYSSAPATPSDPFSNAPVVPDEYTWEDLVTWFNADCIKPL